MGRCPVTEEHRRFYKENGYVQFKDFFSRDEVGHLRDALDHSVEHNRERILGGKGQMSEDYNRVFNQLVNLWTDYPAVKAYTFHPGLAESARRLSGARHVRLYHDHALIKPPGETSLETNWHQDAPYWPMDPVGSLSAWIALDDVDLNNGCLHTPNRSDRFRRALAIIYIPDYTIFLGGKDAAGAKDEMEVGKPWDHPIHPILAGNG